LRKREKPDLSGFVTGNDFSRADKANKINWALAPAQGNFATSLDCLPIFSKLYSAFLISHHRAFE
jgi:hypothetical protein